MWLLVRSGGRGLEPRELASCPDTVRPAGDAEPWQWTLSLAADNDVQLSTNPDLVLASTRVYTDPAPLHLTRGAGTILALVPTAGSWQVSVSGGPWKRLLDCGDLFIAEDDRREEISVATASTAPHLAISILTLESASPTPLRWIP